MKWINKDIHPHEKSNLSEEKKYLILSEIYVV